MAPNCQTAVGTAMLESTLQLPEPSSSLLAFLLMALAGLLQLLVSDSTSEGLVDTGLLLLLLLFVVGLVVQSGDKAVDLFAPHSPELLAGEEMTLDTNFSEDDITTTSSSSSTEVLHICSHSRGPLRDLSGHCLSGRSDRLLSLRDHRVPMVAQLARGWKQPPEPPTDYPPSAGCLATNPKTLDEDGRRAQKETLDKGQVYNKNWRGQIMRSCKVIIGCGGAWPGNPTGVSAVGAHFLSEAGGEAGVAHGQVLGFEPLFPQEGCDGLLRGGDEVLLIYGVVV
ncbi:hypothetical protein INR49_030600 [Caranx melampygus]|nr:hypothetical protein INR49_030600 [Caranx melampygus]